MKEGDIVLVGGNIHDPNLYMGVVVQVSRDAPTFTGYQSGVGTAIVPGSTSVAIDPLLVLVRRVTKLNEGSEQEWIPSVRIQGVYSKS